MSKLRSPTELRGARHVDCGNPGKIATFSPQWRKKDNFPSGQQLVGTGKMLRHNVYSVDAIPLLVTGSHVSRVTAEVVSKIFSELT